MKIKFKDATYDVYNGGISAYGKTLTLNLIMGGESIESIKENATNVETISILNNDGSYAQKFFGYTELVTAIPRDVIITPVKYGKDGEVIEDAKKGTIAIVTLQKVNDSDGEREDYKPSENVNIIQTLQKELEEANSKIDFILMMME